MAPVSFFKAALAATATVLFSFTHAAPTAAPSLAENTLFDKRGNAPTAKIHGVNLGGWFVLEPWITPSLFSPLPASVVDEWTMSAYLGKTKMEAKMQQHWSTWYTASDFAAMKAAGLNFVRIPIGYWSIAPIAGDPYVQGAYAYLAKAVTWAKNNGLMVMIDLHGAPGSQNGFDNSGHRGAINWLKGNTAAQTQAALNNISATYANNPTVVAVGLVNEPYGPTLGFQPIENFYTSSYSALANTPYAKVIHDGFFGASDWYSWAAARSRVIIDTHYYQVFSVGQLQESPATHISTACQFGSSLKTNTIVGEFSGAFTDCAKWLNGRGRGARYDATYDNSQYIGSCAGLSTGTVSGLSATQKSNIAKFAQAQMSQFQRYGGGWIWWTWHTESAPEWDYAALHAAGIIPNVNQISSAYC